MQNLQLLNGAVSNGVRQSLMQLLYLVPPALLLWRSFSDSSTAIVLITPEEVDAAAQRLGIHRHTVRHRLRRAEGVLGRSLDDPAVRADLWFALRATQPATALAVLPGDPDRG